MLVHQSNMVNTVTGESSTEPEDMLFSLTYVSSAVELFSKSELEHLMALSRENNAKRGVTGMLLYKEGNFMQVLEGDEREVRILYEKISADTRHKDDIVLLQGPVAERQFPDWAMGFRDLDSLGVQDIPGYSEFLNTPLSEREFFADPTRSQKLLLSFKQSM